MLNIEKYENEIRETFGKRHKQAFGMYSNEEILGETLVEVADNHKANTSTICKLLDWLYSDAKEPLLDDAEKEYLNNVIKPFRDKVIAIYKSDYDDINEYIAIGFYEYDGDKDIMALPSFKKGTMYKGMVFDMEYTLEELGITYD